MGSRFAQDLPDEIQKAGNNAVQRLYELQQQLSLPLEGVDLLVFLGEIERKFIRAALDRCNGNQVYWRAALLHISRDQLRYRLDD